MKTLQFVGTSLDDLRAFPTEARQRAGYQLFRVQSGKEPSDWKPMNSIGTGVREIRIHTGSAFRVIYVSKFGDTVYILHAFQKKTQKTASRDIAIARKRYREVSSRKKR